MNGSGGGEKKDLKTEEAEAVKRVSKKAYECSGLALGPIVTEKKKRRRVCLRL